MNMNLDEKLIEQIVEAVLRKLADQEEIVHETAADTAEAETPATGATVADGVFQDMDVCIQATCRAQRELVALPLEVRAQLIAAIRDTGRANAEVYGDMEFEETGFGKPGDNVAKNTSACEVMGMEDLVPEVYAGDKGVTIIERLPVGVIASVHPVTNAAPSILFNAVMMLSGGNAVVVNPHPKTKKVSARVIRDLNRAITTTGGPPNCLGCLEEPSVPSAQHLMTHADIGMIAVTGGHGVVEARFTMRLR